MKHLTTLLCIFIYASLFTLFSTQLTAQCNGTIVLTTQTQVNNFACTNIMGDLIIADDNDGIDNIVSLDPIWVNGLNSGSAVTGNVEVLNCTSLTSLIGLDGIGSINGSFVVADNPILNSVFLMDLMFLDGDFIYINNGDIQNITDFAELQSIGGYLEIVSNASLENIVFENLVSIGNYLEFFDSPSVTNISFPSLESTGGHMVIFVLNQLQELSGAFPMLTSIGWFLQISNNDNMEIIDDFPLLTSIGNDFNINNNLSLEQVNGFDNLNSVSGIFRVHDNPNLSECCWTIPVINLPPSSVEIYGNDTGCESESEVLGPPTLECMPDFTVSTTEGECTALVTMTDPTPVENCVPYVMYTLTLMDADGNLIYDGVNAVPGLEETLELPAGDNTYAYLLQAATGEFINCTTVVTVEDNEAPTWDLGTNTLTVIGECGVDDLGDLFNDNTPTATDNCTDMINYAAIGPIDEFICPSGAATQHTYTFFANDGAGNEAESFSLIIRFEDTTPPELIGIPDNVTISCDDNFPLVPVPIAIDECDGDISDEVTGIGSVSIGPCGLGEIAELHEYAFSVTDGCGNVAGGTWTVTVISDFEFDLGGDVVECNESEYTIDPGVDGNFYEWSTGDNDETLTVDASGDYSVTITTNNGCCFSDMVNITFGQAINIMTQGATLDCTGADVQLFAEADAMGASFSWSGPGGYMSTDQNPFVSEAGEYTVSVMDANGCTTTATVMVDANMDVPDISAAGGTLTCAETAVTLMGSSMTANTTFSWTGPNGFMSSEANPSVGEVGTYTLSVLAENGCVATQSVVVDENVVSPALMISEGAIDCATATQTLTGTAEMGATGFAWTGPNGFVSNEAEVAISDSGTYTFSAVGTNGCTGTVDFVVAESISYVPTISTTDIDNDNDTGTATISIAGGVMPFNIFWDNGDSGEMATGLSAGIHTVTVVDGIPCSNMFEFEILDNTSSVSDEQLQDQISVYPNPVDNLLHVEFKSGRSFDWLEITDLQGRLIYQTELQTVTNISSVNTSELNSGIYIITIRSEDAIVSKKFFKI